MARACPHAELEAQVPKVPTLRFLGRAAVSAARGSAAAPWPRRGGCILSGMTPTTTSWQTQTQPLQMRCNGS